MTITVGSSTQEVEVPDDLLTRYDPDALQDKVMHIVGRAFVQAYIEEFPYRKVRGQIVQKEDVMPHENGSRSS